MLNFNSIIENHIVSLKKSKKKINIFLHNILKIIETNIIYENNKILIAGNGGSASDANHFAAELTGKFKSIKRIPISAISLSENSSSITAIANDLGFENIFSRQIEALGNKGDIIFLFSTSGKSKNIIKAARIAKKKSLIIISITGSFNSELKKYSDLYLKINSQNTALIQEINIIIIHLICYSLEKYKKR